MEDIAEVAAPSGDSAYFLAWNLLGPNIAGDPDELMISVMKTATATLLRSFESYLVEEVEHASVATINGHDRWIAI